jgi:hypothetical protein
LVCVVAKLRGIWCARHVFCCCLGIQTSWVVADATSSPFVGFGDCTIPSFFWALQDYGTYPCTTNHSLSQKRKTHTHTHTHTHMSKWCSNFVTLWLMVKEETKKSITSRDQVQPICHMQSWLEHVMKHYWTWGSCFALPSMVPFYSQGSNLEARMNQIWPTHHHPLQSLL